MARICKYVSNELFDERTNAQHEMLKELKKSVNDLATKVDHLDRWKLKVVTGSTLIAGLATILWKVVAH